jgi:hypothetical protein
LPKPVRHSPSVALPDPAVPARPFWQWGLVPYGAAMILGRFPSAILSRASAALWIASLFIFVCGWGEWRLAWQRSRALSPWAAAGLLSLFLAVNLFAFDQLPNFIQFDAVRDTGLYARGLAQGAIPNVFAWGYRFSYNLFSQSFNAALYPLLGDSDRLCRVPAVVIAITTLSSLAWLAWVWAGWMSAVVSAGILLCLPWHLLEARTETTVEFVFFWTVVLLGGLLLVARRPRTRTFALVGLIAGFVLPFHAAARAAAFATVAVMLAIAWEGVARREWGWLQALRWNACTVGAAIVGLGPVLWYSTPFILFGGAGKVSLSRDPGLVQLGHLASRYLPSLGLYLFQPAARFYYPADRPLLNACYAPLFLWGIARLVRDLDRPARATLALLLLLPLTNGALADASYDYRLAPLMVMGSWVCGLAFSRAAASGRGWYPRAVLALGMGLAVAGAAWDAEGFFGEAPLEHRAVADDTTPTTAYLYMRLMRALHDWKGSAEVCLSADADTVAPMSLKHMTELAELWAPHLRVYANVWPGAEPGKLYLSAVCPQLTSAITWTDHRFCETYRKYDCPPDWSGPFHLMIGDR